MGQHWNARLACFNGGHLLKNMARLPCQTWPAAAAAAADAAAAATPTTTTTTAVKTQYPKNPNSRPEP